MIKVENATQIRPHSKANELKKLTFVRPFHLVGLLSTTDHTTQETRPTAGSTCRRETHLMPSYPDPAPRSPWKAHAAKRAESSGQHVPERLLGQGFRVAKNQESEGPPGCATRIWLMPSEDRTRYCRVKACTGDLMRY